MTADAETLKTSHLTDVTEVKLVWTSVRNTPAVTTYHHMCRQREPNREV